MNCPHCGTATPDDSRFCPGCGKATTAAAAISRESLLLAAIGSRAERYLPRFLAREQGERGAMGWHWPALFATFGWLLYRKMYGLALAYAAIAFLLAPIVAPLLIGALKEVGSLLALLIYLGLLVLPALFADALYHRHCRRIIDMTQRYQPDQERQLEQIRLSGGPGAAWLIPVLLAFAIIPVLGILAAIALPAYQDYVARAKTSSAYSQMLKASRAVSVHYTEQGRLPANLEDAGFVAEASDQRGDIRLDNDGVISTTIRVGNQEKSLQLRPALVSEGQLEWRCDAATMPDKWLPIACRAGSR